MAHTPTPWLTDGSMVYSEVHGDLGEAYMRWSSDASQDIDAETANANAAMWAAAPDMLDALHNALSSGLPDVVAEAVRAAISKAEGRK